MGPSRDEQGENNRSWPRHISALSFCARTVPFVRIWQQVYWWHEYERRGMCGVPLSSLPHNNTISCSASLMKLAFHSSPRPTYLNPPSGTLSMKWSFSVVVRLLPDRLSLVPVGIVSGSLLIFLLDKYLSKSNWSAIAKSVMCSARTLTWSCSCLHCVECSRFGSKRYWKESSSIEQELEVSDPSSFLKTRFSTCSIIPLTFPCSHHRLHCSCVSTILFHVALISLSPL